MSLIELMRGWVDTGWTLLVHVVMCVVCLWVGLRVVSLATCVVAMGSVFCFLLGICMWSRSSGVDHFLAPAVCPFIELMCNALTVDGQWWRMLC